MYVAVRATSASGHGRRRRAVRLADGRDLRVGEDDPRHGGVVGLAVVAEDVRRRDPALVLADVGQRPDAGDVADRPDALARAHPRVDGDPAAAGREADGLEAEAAGPRPAPGRHEQAVAAQDGAVGELEHVLAAGVAAGGAHVAPEVQLDAVGPQRLGQRVAERRRLARQQPVGALDDRDLGAHPPDGLAELDPDRAAAEDQQPAGDRAQRGRLAVGPHALEPVQARDRREHRIRAGRDHDVGGEQRLVADHDPAGAVEAARAADDLDPCAARPRDLAGVVVAADHEVAPGQDGRRIEAAAVDRLRGARHLARRLQGLARADERLGGDAAPVRALAAEQLALDQSDPPAALGQPRGAVLAGRAAAEDDDVEHAAHARPLARSISYAAVMRPMWL